MEALRCGALWGGLWFLGDVCLKEIGGAWCLAFALLCHEKRVFCVIPSRETKNIKIKESKARRGPGVRPLNKWSWES